MKWSIVLLWSVEYSVGILIRITLNLFIAFGKIAMFTLLVLPIQEHGRFFLFLISSATFSSKLKVLVI